MQRDVGGGLYLDITVILLVAYNGNDCSRLSVFTSSGNAKYLHKVIMKFCSSFPVEIQHAEDDDRQKYRMRQLERRSTSWKQNLSHLVSC